jgi:hypothetical protein
MARLGGGVAARDARPRLYCSRCGGRDFRTDVVRGAAGQGLLALPPPPAPRPRRAARGRRGKAADAAGGV